MMRREIVLLLLLSGCGSSLRTADGGADVTTLDVLDATSVSDANDVGADVAMSVESGADVPAITAPDETWTWIDVPGSHCANGTPTGFGVNLTTRSNNVLIFLQGGGACWDAASCWGPVSTSFYVATGYGRTEFDTDAIRVAMLPMRRADPTNPFKDMNLVYIPYCTGDVHAGDRVTTYNYNGTDHETWHVGLRNLQLYLSMLAATFPSTTRVWLSGDSAGGFGSALDFPVVQDAFPGARVDVLDDSGQPIDPDPVRWQQWRDAWNVHLPADCPMCADHIGAFIDYYRGRYPGHRFGILSYTNDSVITTFMNLQPATFNTELNALADHIDSSWPDGKYYFVPGLLHVLLTAPPLPVIDWINAMIHDDPTWHSSRP